MLGEPTWAPTLRQWALVGSDSCGLFSLVLCSALLFSHRSCVCCPLSLELSPELRLIWRAHAFSDSVNALHRMILFRCLTTIQLYFVLQFDRNYRRTSTYSMIIRHYRVSGEDKLKTVGSDEWWRGECIVSANMCCSPLNTRFIHWIIGWLIWMQFSLALTSLSHNRCIDCKNNCEQTNAKN